MARAHEPDYEAEAADSRHAVQSEDEREVSELAERHVWDVHGQTYTDETLRRTPEIRIRNRNNGN